MTKQMQRALAALLLITLLAACAGALAESRNWQLSEDDAAINYDITNYDAELPAELKSALAGSRFRDWQCMKGIMLKELKKGTSLMFRCTALMTVQKDGKTMLLQFASVDGKSWKVQPAGEEKALLPGREYAFDCVLDKFPLVEIVYPMEGGGREVFAFSLCLYNTDFVLLQSYCRENQDGSMLTISGKQGFFSLVGKTPAGEIEATDDLKYPFPNSMEALDAAGFPKTVEDVKAYIAANPQPLAEGYSMLGNTNMRAKTSSKSDKLGAYSLGTLAKVLEKKRGTTHPWYKVQVGQTVGYISEPYLAPQTGMSIPQFFLGSPLPVGRLKKDADLMAYAKSRSDTVGKLTAGTAFYVLADCGDWLHVCIPQGELGYWMDVNGTFGYLLKKDVLQADSPLRLKFLQ